MDTPVPPRRPATLSVLGVLNIVFGSLGLLCNCLFSFNAAGVVMMGSAMESAQAQSDAKRASSEQDFEDRLAEVETEEDREDIEKERDRWRAKNPDIDFAAMYAWARETRFIVYACLDALLGLITGLLLLISGIGLLKASGWARKLALGTAGTKIFVNLLSAAYLVLVIVPLVSAGMADSLQEIQKIQPGGGPPADFAPMIGEMYQTMGTGWALIVGVGSCIYPVILLILLNLRSVKREFAVR